MKAPVERWNQRKRATPALLLYVAHVRLEQGGAMAVDIAKLDISVFASWTLTTPVPGMQPVSEWHPVLHPVTPSPFEGVIAIADNVAIATTGISIWALLS
jgi:hypothetical protein